MNSYKHDTHVYYSPHPLFTFQAASWTESEKPKLSAEVYRQRSIQLPVTASKFLIRLWACGTKLRIVAPKDLSTPATERLCNTTHFSNHHNKYFHYPTTLQTPGAPLRLCYSWTSTTLTQRKQMYLKTWKNEGVFSQCWLCFLYRTRGLMWVYCC